MIRGVRGGCASATGRVGEMAGASLKKLKSIGSKTEPVGGQDMNASMVHLLFVLLVGGRYFSLGGGSTTKISLSPRFSNIFLLTPFIDNFTVGVRGYNIIIFTIDGP
jgi:hypothetical protein